MAGKAGPDISEYGVVGYWDAANAKSYNENPSSNLVSNGGFDSDSGWAHSANFTIADGVLHCVSDGTYEYAVQGSKLTVGKLYRVTGTVSNWSSGNVRMGSTASPFSVSSDGDFTYTWMATHTDAGFYIERVGACNMDIDDILVQKLSSDWHDLSGNRNTGTLISGSSYNTGSGGNIQFDGTNDYVDIPTILNSESIGVGTALTISFFFNASTLGTKMPFSTGQTGDDGIYMWVDNLHTWRIGDYTSTTGHSTIYPNIWYYTTLVINGLNISAYLNGELDYTGTYTAFTTAYHLTLGKHGTSTSYPFAGKISNVQIYNRALSQSEITQNFQAMRSRYGI